MNNLLVTNNAAKKIIELSKKKEKKMLRISVTGGGCQGFQYNLDMEDNSKKSDVIIKKNNALVVIDQSSLDLIKGSEIDFVEDLIVSNRKNETNIKDVIKVFIMNYNIIFIVIIFFIILIKNVRHLLF